MKTRNMIMVVLMMVLTTAILTGCKGARFITAKVKVMEAASIGNMEELKYLMTSDTLPAADQVKGEQLREQTQTFNASKEKDFYIYGDASDRFTTRLLAVSMPNDQSTYPLPVEILIVTSSGHRVGEAMSNGYAEFRFGNQGPVYTTDASNTFFKFEVSAVYNDNGDKVAAGKFNAIARNKDDANDTKRLIVIDGAFIARVN